MRAKKRSRSLPATQRMTIDISFDRYLKVVSISSTQGIPYYRVFEEAIDLLVLAYRDEEATADSKGDA